MRQQQRSIIQLILFLLITQGFALAGHRLTLEQAIQIAFEKNPATNIARGHIAEAEAKMVQARAYRLPQVSLLSKYFYTNNLPNMYPQALNQVPVMTPGGPIAGQFVPMRPKAPFPGNNRDVFKMDVNLVYPFYTGGKISAANRNAKLLKNLFQKNMEQTKAEIAYKVSLAFYNVLFLNNVIDVYQAALRQLNQHMELAQKAYQQGVRSRFDVLQFQSKIEEFKSQIENFKGKLTTAKTGLKNLLNLPLNDSLTVVGNLNAYQLKIDTTGQIFTRAKNENYQLQMLSLKSKLYDNLKAINKADRLPKLFAFANFHVYHGMDFPPYDEGWRNGWATGVGVSFSLFDGQLSKGKVQEAEANRLVTESQQQGLLLKIRFKLKAALENIRSLQAELRALNKSLEVASEGYKIAKVSYENGIITNVQLEDAHLNILRMQVRILKVKKSLLEQQAQILQLIGQYQQ